MNKRYLWSVALLAFLLGISTNGLSWALGRTAGTAARRGLAIGDVPAPVQAAILAEILSECFELEITTGDDDDDEDENDDDDAGGDAEDDDAGVFEVEFEFGGREFELEITADGKVIEKSVGDDDGDEDEDDDDDDEDDDDDD
jgi:hypothetical protein